MKVQFIIITLLGLLSCNPGHDRDMQVAEAKDASIEVPLVNIDSLDYVVFTYDSSTYSLYWNFSKNLRPVALTKEEISQAELLILKQIDLYNQSRTEEFHQMNTKYPDYNFQIETFIIENPAKYARQYIPAINSDGEKILYVNAFCSLQEHDYWKKGLVEVMDGGECYFQMIINLTKEEVVEFNVNGVA